MKEQYYPLSYSSLKEFGKSPAHFIAYKNKERTESAAMRFGTAVHSAVLEPEKFKAEYLTTDVRRGTKAHKALMEENPEKSFLNGSDWFGIGRIKDNVQRNELASDLLNHCDKIEQLVEGEIEGIPFRGFVDAMSSDYLVDLKTTKDGSEREFQRSAFNFKYYLQAAVYRELTGVDDFWIITAENSAPYTITPYLMSQSYLDRGYAELMKLISDFKAWDGKAQGYTAKTDTEFFTLDAPTWA